MLKANTENLNFYLLGELLFPERAVSPLLANRIRQSIKRNGLRIADKQLNDIYRTGVSRDLLWLLLSSEAENAGIRMSDDSTRTQLASVLPQLFNNVEYGQIIGSIMQQTPVSEEQIVHTFGKVFAVIIYAREACSNESFTNNQISKLTSYQNESVTALERICF
jgi:hypothetical protein